MVFRTQTVNFQVLNADKTQRTARHGGWYMPVILPPGKLRQEKLRKFE